MNCIFCKIVSEEIPCYKIYEDDDILSFLDVNPVDPGHTLIIPKKHTLDLMSINDEILIKIFNKARDISSLLMEKLGADGFTLVQNNGIAQEVKHYHLHIMPKYKNKCNMTIEEVYKKLND